MKEKSFLSFMLTGRVLPAGLLASCLIQTSMFPNSSLLLAVGVFISLSFFIYRCIAEVGGFHAPMSLVGSLCTSVTLPIILLD